MRIVAAVTAALALAGAGNAVGAPVTLTKPAPIAKDNAALPRITAPATPATAKVNAALARLDTGWRAFLRQCRADGGRDAYASRSVSVVMAGPKVLSLVVGEEAGCGGAHPNSTALGLAYDLDTGRPLDWTKLLPPRMVGASAIDTSVSGTTVGTVTSAALHALYLKAVTARNGADASWKSDCAEVVADEEIAFQLWPDARKDAVVLQPFSLPHAVAACGDEVAVPTATLRGMGVDTALLDAIDAAHRGPLEPAAF